MGRDARLSIVRDNAVGVLDRLGRHLEVGDLVVPTTSGPLLMRVTDVRAQMDPAHPKGHIIRGEATFSFFAPAGRPLPELLFVARPPKPEDGAGAAQESPEPPPMPQPSGRLGRVLGWLRRA